MEQGMDAFCCPVFTEMLYEAGRKGFSIIPYKFPGETDYFFILQFRSQDSANTSGRLTVGQMAIKYCPWCGTLLADVIESNKSMIIELAEKNKGLFT